MNWGIIGLGHMGKQFANSIKEVEKSSLIGISSKSFFKLIKFGLKYNIKIKYLFRNYEEILLCKEIDNIYIGTLNNTHYDLIEKCIEAKKNILCEKPFVINFDQAKNIRDKLKNSNILFLEAIAYRSHPQIRNVIDLIKSNTIGNVIKINSSFGFNAGAPKNNSRLFSKKLGGGSILDLGCYPVSISNLIANISLNLKKNIPVLKNVNGKIYNSEIDLNAKAELVYENGVRSEISVSINENLDNTTTIFGSTGKLIILNPWLPGKESIIEIHKDNQIEKIKTKSDLSIFASQIDCFNKNIEKRNLECDYPSMSIDNSVDCMQIITDWKNKIFENENKKFKK
tara:strand:- start:664 stop:1686 length:1023 start_codon:yes stop_codon:yes gene_type:complete